MIDTSRIILYVLEHIELVNIRCYFLFSVAIDATNSLMEATNSLLFDADNSLFDAKMEATISLFSLFGAKMEATTSLFAAVEFFNSSQILCQCLSIKITKNNELLIYLNIKQLLIYP